MFLVLTEEPLFVFVGVQGKAAYRTRIEIRGQIVTELKMQILQSTIYLQGENTQNHNNIKYASDRKTAVLKSTLSSAELLRSQKVTMDWNKHLSGS